MSYDEVEIEDFDWDEGLQAFTYSCPCGDLFQITMVRATACPPAGRVAPTELRPARALTVMRAQEELAEGEQYARCPSCSLYLTVVYNPEDWMDQARAKPGDQSGPPARAVAAA